MVTNGKTEYSLFRLYRYSRFYQVNTEVDEGNLVSVKRLGSSDRSCARASSPHWLEQWGHVSVQPLWCRVTTETNQTGISRTWLTVEWYPESSGITKEDSNKSNHNAQTASKGIILVRLSFIQETVDFNALTWLPKGPQGSPQRPLETQFSLKATYQGHRVGFRCRRHDLETDVVRLRLTQDPWYRFQLQFMNPEEAQTFVQRIQVRF